MPESSQNRISAINSPHELALGVAFGVVIGLMPKDSAIVWAIGLIFLLSRANLLCGIILAVVMSLVSPSLDGIFDKMGTALLTNEALQGTFASWLDIPWMAWTRFNNTVVAGSLFVGVLLCLPVYLLGQIFFRVWGISMIESFMSNRLIRFLFGDADDHDLSAETVDAPLTVENSLTVET